MATLSDGAFRFLSLCAQPLGSAAVARRLSTALTAVESLDELVTAAEHHGMEPLVLAHIEWTRLAIPDEVRARLRARQTQHAHAASVRSRVIAQVVCAMAQARVPLLFLKGAALAHLVYDNARLRPMRDVDLLVRKPDIARALDVLTRCGFTPAGIVIRSRYHHLRGMARTMDGATVTIELHHELMARTPFVESLSYDDLIRRSQPFDWDGMPCRTLGCEDMLWHVYAHAFVVNTLLPGSVRLLSIADLVHATEAWIDRVDLDLLGRRHGRLRRALQVLPDVVRARPIDSDQSWSAALIPVALWPPDWWFRMRYGITAWPRWLWFRAAGHPARLALSAGRAVMTRLPLRQAASQGGTP